MQYFIAVQKGRQRASKSQMRLFDIAGFAMLTLTTKKINGEFFPVGEEEFAAVIETRDGFVAIIVDGEGYTKAQSKAIEREEAFMIFDKMIRSGMEEFPGSSVEIWTESYPKAARRE